MTSRRKQYTAAFKLQVIKAAEETNNCAAAREFCVRILTSQMYVLAYKSTPNFDLKEMA